MKLDEPEKLLPEGVKLSVLPGLVLLRHTVPLVTVTVVGHTLVTDTPLMWVTSTVSPDSLTELPDVSSASTLKTLLLLSSWTANESPFELGVVLTTIVRTLQSDGPSPADVPEVSVGLMHTNMLPVPTLAGAL